MKKSLRILTLDLICVAFMLASCGSNKKPVVQVPAAPTHEQIVQSGEYLVTIMGCNDCHSPKKMGPNGPEVIAEIKLSGYPASRPLPKVNKEALKSWVLLNEDLTAAVGPWGVSFSANLTPDQTGLGNWADDNFKRALKEGWFKGLEGTRKLLPPMPWQEFAALKDDDITAILTYLKSLKPVSNAVPDALSPDEIK